MTSKTIVSAIAAGVLSVTLASAGTARAQDSLTNAWNYEGAIYLWGASIGGKTTTGEDIDIGFNDLLKNLDFGGMVLLAAQRGPWTLFGDFIYLDVESNQTALAPIGSTGTTPLSTGVKLEAFITTIAPAYRIYESDNTKLSALAGARYLWVKSDLNLSRGFGLGGVTFSGSESALDGVVGLRGEARFNDDWSFSYYLDAGAGDSSFTGQTILAANYTYKSVEFALGYRYAYWDLKDFGPFDTMTLHGPLGYGSSSSAGAAPVQCGLRTMAGARGAAFAGVLNLAACSASTPDIVASSVPPPTPAQRVFVASSRAPSGDAAVFGRVRSTALTWARFDVSVPPDRKPGQVTMPLSKPPDPLTEFLISDAATYPSRNAFAASVERALLASGGPEWSIVIYVHGFNHSFADGLFRHAQIMVDFDSPSISVGYTWPSAGVSELYLYDRDSAFLPAPVWRS